MRFSVADHLRPADPELFPSHPRRRFSSPPQAHLLPANAPFLSLSSTNHLVSWQVCGGVIGGLSTLSAMPLPPVPRPSVALALHSACISRLTAHAPLQHPEPPLRASSSMPSSPGPGTHRFPGTMSLVVLR